MSWQNPWAWLGLLTLALPVLIHLLGRGHARVLPFPSLRFLERSRLLPTRRTRLHDIPLLLVRLAILLAAVAALGQPLFRSSDRARAVAQTLARAIIVDTSFSMRDSARSARAEATRLAGESQTSLVVATAEPSREITGAVAWLERQPGRREIAVVSDFQAGTLDSADLAAVPRDIGLRLTRIASTKAPLEIPSSSHVAAATLAADRTDATWIGRSTAPHDDGLALLTSGADKPRADAARQAAASLAVRLPLDTSRSIAIVYPGHARPAAEPIDSAWMTNVVAALRSDSLLIAATRATRASGDASGLIVARDAESRPIITATRAAGQLVLSAAVDPGSIASAALIAAVQRARSLAPPLAELDPSTIADQTLEAWQRQPSTSDRAQPSGDSDGRWFWIAALLLLALETWMRRARRVTAAVELVHDRAA